MKNNFLTGLILASILFACGFHNDKNTGSGNLKNSAFVDGSGRILIPAGRAPGYDTVKALVFQKNCIDCHGRRGGVNLETYANTRKVLEGIRETVLEDQTMPPRSPLADDQMQLVRLWLDAGAPEQDVSINDPASTPVPTVTPVRTNPPMSTPTPEPSATPFGVVHFAEVNTGIFVPKCLSCHNDTRSKGHVNLSTYDLVIKNLKGVEEEALVNLTMPPKNHPLSTDEQKLLRTWIDQGAKP